MGTPSDLQWDSAGHAWVNNRGAVFWILPLVFFGTYFVYSARREEQFMISEFPEQYPAYIKRSHMLLPWPSRADLKPGSET